MCRWLACCLRHHVLSSTAQARWPSLPRSLQNSQTYWTISCRSPTPVMLAGDVNIRLERITDPNVAEFGDLLSCYGLAQRIQVLHTTPAKHSRWFVHVTTCHHWLSDHQMLCWSTSLLCPPSVYAADRGGHLTQTRSRPTSLHLHCVTSNSGLCSTVMVL